MWYVHIRNTTECKRSERCAQNISSTEPWGVEFGRCWWGGEHFRFKIVRTKKNKKQSTYNLRKKWNKIRNWKGLSLLREVTLSEVCVGRLQHCPCFAVRPALAPRRLSPGASRRPADLVGETRRWCKGGEGGWLSVPSGPSGVGRASLCPVQPLCH